MTISAVANGGPGDRSNGTVSEPRLVRAAHEFEAQMMKELLKPMTEADALFADSDGNETGVMGEFATESLAGALSAGGGFGIADRIVHSLSHFGNRSESAPVIESPQFNTTISTGK